MWGFREAVTRLLARAIAAAAAVRVATAAALAAEAKANLEAAAGAEAGWSYFAALSSIITKELLIIFKMIFIGFSVDVAASSEAF